MTDSAHTTGINSHGNLVVTISPSTSTADFWSLASPAPSARPVGPSDQHFLPHTEPASRLDKAIAEAAVVNELRENEHDREKARKLAKRPWHRLSQSVARQPAVKRLLSVTQLQTPLSHRELSGASAASRKRRRRKRSLASSTADPSRSLLSRCCLGSASAARLQRALDHFVTSIVILSLALTLAILLILRMAYNRSEVSLLAVAVAILALFTVELVLRILAYRAQFLFNPIHVICALLTLLTYLFILNAFDINVIVNNTVAMALQGLQLVLRFASVSWMLPQSARRMVSTNKTRFTEFGFDLDLVYITERVIAMGLPSQKIEGLYRNPIDQVVRFFNSRHSNHYLIVNLCSERDYPSHLFDGRVLRFPFDDHNPCPLPTIVDFCALVERFLAESPSNIVAIHCKGGKGRTGTMIACWLLYAAYRDANQPRPSLMFADDALKMFAGCRTAVGLGSRMQGVSGPSQKRYVHYFEKLCWMRIQQRAAAIPPAGASASTSKKDSELALEQKEEWRDYTAPPQSITPAPHLSLASTPIYPYTLPSVPNAQEEKEWHDNAPQPVVAASGPSLLRSIDPPLSQSNFPASTDAPSPSDSSVKFRAFASSFLYHSPKCEIVALVVNNPFVGERSLESGGREDWLDEGESWSLIISHYRPVVPNVGRATDTQPVTSVVSELNRYNAQRYAAVHEFFFQSRPRHSQCHRPQPQQLSDPLSDLVDVDDTSIVFDISSFHANSKSLILNGDLKFQLYRGSLNVDGSTGRRAVQRKVSRAKDASIRLVGFFWINTAFLAHPSAPASSPGTSPAASSCAPSPPSPPRELILRRNQIDEAFKSTELDADFNAYLYYHSPPQHQSAAPVEELHAAVRQQLQRLKRQDEARKRAHKRKLAPSNEKTAAEIELGAVGSDGFNGLNEDVEESRSPGGVARQANEVASVTVDITDSDAPVSGRPSSDSNASADSVGDEDGDDEDADTDDDSDESDEDEDEDGPQQDFAA